MSVEECVDLQWNVLEISVRMVEMPSSGRIYARVWKIYGSLLALMSGETRQ